MPERTRTFIICSGARLPVGRIGTWRVGKAGEALKKNRDGRDPIDVAVGAKIRLRRNELGISQKALADALGVTFQQVQKYENGANRVSASSLARIAKTLQTPIAEFFDNEPDAAPNLFEMISAPGAADMLRAYAAIPSAESRQALLAVVRLMAG